MNRECSSCKRRDCRGCVLPCGNQDMYSTRRDSYRGHSESRTAFCFDCGGDGCNRCRYDDCKVTRRDCVSPCIPICPPPCRPVCPPVCPPCKLDVYGSTTLSRASPLSIGQSTLVFSNVVKQSTTSTSQPVYNNLTGIFTVPECGDGMYTLTAHLEIDAATELPLAVQFTINVNGTPIIASKDTITVTPIKKSYDLTIVYPLTKGQMVSVTATSSIAAVVSLDPLSSFSFVKSVSF